MWKNKERSVDYGGVFGLSIIKHVTLQKIVAHDFRYDPHISCEVNFILMYINNYDEEQELHFVNTKLVIDLYDQVMIFSSPPKSITYVRDA